MTIKDNRTTIRRRKDRYDFSDSFGEQRVKVVVVDGEC